MRPEARGAYNLACKYLSRIPFDWQHRMVVGGSRREKTRRRKALRKFQLHWNRYLKYSKEN